MIIIKKILLIQTAFIGDAILATALLEELRLQYPGAELHYLVRKGNESLFVAHPYLKRLLVWDKKGGKYRNLWKLLRIIRSEKYDLLINTQRFGATGFLTVFSAAVETAGFDKNPLSFLFTRKVKHEYGIHEVERNLRLIGRPRLGNGRPKLYPSAANEAKTEGYKTGSYYTIAPASVWYTKQFPESKWTEFLDSIQKPVTVYLVGGPGDHAMAERILHAVRNELISVVNLCGKLDLLDTASLMRDARMNYTNDSGPMHIASAMNAPVRAIYCSTVPSFGFGPLSDDSRIVETLLALECRPCGIHGHKACPLGHFNCAYSIDKAQLAVENG